MAKGIRHRQTGWSRKSRIARIIGWFIPGRLPVLWGFITGLFLIGATLGVTVWGWSIGSVLTAAPLFLTAVAWQVNSVAGRLMDEATKVADGAYGQYPVLDPMIFPLPESLAPLPPLTDPKINKIREEYGRAVALDSSGYQERLEEAETGLVEEDEAASGIEAIQEMLGGVREEVHLTSPGARQAVAYTASSVLEVFRLIGPPPPGVSGPAPGEGGDAPDSGAGIPQGGRRG